MNPLLACSGPGAMEAIALSYRIGFVSLAVALGLVIAMIAASRNKKRWAGLVLPVIHPGWWMGGSGGDCGYMLRYTSLASTAVLAGVATWVIWRARVKLPA